MPLHLNSKSRPIFPIFMTEGNFIPYPLFMICSTTNFFWQLWESNDGFRYEVGKINRRPRHTNTRLESLGVTGSHSRKSLCLYNDCIESFFRISKQSTCNLNNVIQKQKFCKPWGNIYYYNYHHFQAKLKQRAPIEDQCALLTKPILQTT